MAKAGSSPLSSAAPASDVEMADGASSPQQNGSTRKPREATKKRPAVDAAGSDSSGDDDDEATAISRAKAKAVAASNSSKAGQLYCHQDHTGHDAAKEILLRCTGSKPVSTKPGAPHKACILMYCEKCLKKHYDEDARKTIAQGEQDEWKCPSCRNICSCSVCRRKSAIAAGEAPPPKRAPPGQGKSIQYSRAEGAKGKKKRVKNAVFHGDDSDSSLSSLDSDGERRGGGLAKRNAPRVKQPATINIKRASPPPRPPKAVTPPKTFPLASLGSTPSTSSILARLHLRAFVLRFLPLMPSLQGSSQKVTTVLTYLSDDLLWMWSRRDAEYAQRLLLRGLLELIEKEHEVDIFAERASRRSMVDLVDNQMKRALSSSSREEVVKPWVTLREIVEAEEVWGSWGDRVAEWEAEREEVEGPESELRGRKGEPSPDEKLALLCSLIELTYNAECVRQALVEGVEAEKQTMVMLNKKKFKQRHDWNETKQTVLAKKPPKPTAPSKGTTLVKLAEVWRSEVQEIDDEVAEAEKESQKETFEIQRYIYLAQSTNRIRFSASGKDAKGNTYYLLSPCNHSSFPSSSTLGVNDDYPLSWAILVHGTPFDLSPVGETAKSATKKVANGKSNGAAMEEEEEKPTVVPAAIGSVEEREQARAKNGDAWFLVDPEREGDLMIEWIEYAAKWVTYERKKVAYERQKEGKPELPEDAVDAKEESSDLLNQMRVYVEYVKAARELAKVEAKNKGKGRAAAMKDKTYTVESDEDELEDDEDELDSD